VGVHDDAGLRVVVVAKNRHVLKIRKPNETDIIFFRGTANATVISASIPTRPGSVRRVDV
jgi:hypothetical protein